MMNGQSMRAGWEQSATLPPFGRRLRGYFGDAAVGLPDDMLSLLEKLLEVPGVLEAANGAATPGHAVGNSAR